MKKLIVNLVVVALATLGLVGTASSFQAANATTCPYSGCVATTTTLTGPTRVRSGGLMNFHVAVQPVSGSGHPRGSVTLRCTGPGRTRSKTRAYRGYPRTIVMFFWARGTWTCTATFHSPVKWLSSSDSMSFNVVRRHRH